MANQKRIGIRVLLLCLMSFGMSPNAFSKSYTAQFQIAHGVEKNVGFRDLSLFQGAVLEKHYFDNLNDYQSSQDSFYAQVDSVGAAVELDNLSEPESSQRAEDTTDNSSIEEIDSTENSNGEPQGDSTCLPVRDDDQRAMLMQELLNGTWSTAEEQNGFSIDIQFREPRAITLIENRRSGFTNFQGEYEVLHDWVNGYIPINFIRLTNSGIQPPQILDLIDVYVKLEKTENGEKLLRVVPFSIFNQEDSCEVALEDMQVFRFKPFGGTASMTTTSPAE